jgi:hypothetical protein
MRSPTWRLGRELGNAPLLPNLRALSSSDLAGAAGYLVKDAAKTELELAIQAVARGETYLNPVVAHYGPD